MSGKGAKEIKTQLLRALAALPETQGLDPSTQWQPKLPVISSPSDPTPCSGLCGHMCPRTLVDKHPIIN